VQFYQRFDVPEHRYQMWELSPSADGASLVFDRELAQTTAPPTSNLDSSSASAIGDARALDGTYFFNTGSFSHELKFGASYRSSEVTSTFTFQGPIADNVDRRYPVYTVDTDRFLTGTASGDVVVQDLDGVPADVLPDLRTRPGDVLGRSTTWDQSGPTDTHKIEDTHIFNSNFYLTGLTSYLSGGFQLAPSSGIGDGFTHSSVFRDSDFGGGFVRSPREGAAAAEGVTGCPADDTTDCVNGGRFRVRAYYKKPDGERGAVSLRTLTDDTGYGFIFDEANIELVYKVLEACPVNGQYWVFIAGLTDLAIDVEVVDTLLGKIDVYSNPPGPFRLETDTEAFACERDIAAARVAAPAFSASDAISWLFEQGQRVPAPRQILGSGAIDEALRDEEDEATVQLVRSAAGACVPNATRLCLNDDRFEVTATWRSAGDSGTGQAVELTSDTGYNWFFEQANVELLVKVLRACTLNDRYWVFVAGLTDIEVTVVVRDTVTGRVETYVNPLGQPFVAIADTGSFGC
jgi:hypothetical protein